MAFTRQEWSSVVAIAFAAHFVFIVGFASSTWFGAEGEGIGGVEIGLGDLDQGNNVVDNVEPTPSDSAPDAPQPDHWTFVPQLQPPELTPQDVEISNELEPERFTAPVVEAIQPYSDFDSGAWLRMESSYARNQAVGRGTANTYGGNPGYRVRYADLVRAKLNRFKRYPAAARHQSVEGTATLFLHLRRDGSVVNAYVERSSGNELLDAEVLDIVDRAKPLPKFNESETRESWKLLIPIEFELTKDK